MTPLNKPHREKLRAIAEKANRGQNTKVFIDTCTPSQVIALLDALESAEKTLSLVENYLHHNTDDLCGDDLSGDGRRTFRFKRIISEIEAAKREIFGTSETEKEK